MAYADLRVNGMRFETTTLRVTAQTDAGRAFLAERFGRGCVGCEIRKSGLGSLEMDATSEELELEVFADDA